MGSIGEGRTVFSLFLLAWWTVRAFSARNLPSGTCNPKNHRDSTSLRSDQITVLINGYAESRIPLLQSIASTYSASPIVSSVLVLWGNPLTETQTLVELAQNLTLYSSGTATISLIRQSSNSLNARFLPRSSIGTRSVLISDDDVEIDLKSVEFAFKIWRSNPDRLIGVFVRSHDLDLNRKEWIYSVHPNKYSIVLTKFMMLKTEYLFKYSCGGGAEMVKMRRIVDEMRNCEDILMNFVVADEINAGPIMVKTETARDWGDARNDDRDGGGGDGNGGRGLKDDEGNRVREVGLSSRGKEHRKRRGECIKEFHKAMGRMPLRYSYGVILDSVREQGLCSKDGKLVFCDQN